MTEIELKKKLDELEAAQKALSEKQEKLDLMAKRIQAVNAVHNLISSYVQYHSGSKQQESYDLFVKHTPGALICIDGWGAFLEPEGIKRFFLGWLQNSEADLTNRLYRHDISSPVIEISGDCKTALAIFGSLGLETMPNVDALKGVGKYNEDAEKWHNAMESIWCLGTYEAAFIVEDGEWKIWKLMFRDIFMTPFDSRGWTDVPIHPAYLPNTDIYDDVNPLEGSDMGPDILTRDKHFRPFNKVGTPSNVHDCIPRPPKPFDTWNDNLFTIL